MEEERQYQQTGLSMGGGTLDLDGDDGGSIGGGSVGGGSSARGGGGLGGRRGGRREPQTSPVSHEGVLDRQLDSRRGGGGGGGEKKGRSEVSQPVYSDDEDTEGEDAF